MRLVLRGAVLFIFLLSLGIYSSFKEPAFTKVSREIVSLPEGVETSSSQDLNLLNQKELNVKGVKMGKRALTSEKMEPSEKR